MVKLKIVDISKINDYVVLKLPNGDYAPTEITHSLNVDDVITLIDDEILLGHNEFCLNEIHFDGFVEDFCSLDIALSYLNRW